MDRMLEEVEVSSERLSWLLRSNGLSHQIDEDGCLYVHEADWGYPFWITINRNNKFLRFHTFSINPKRKWTIEEFDFVTRLAAGPIVPRFELSADRLYGEYCLPFAGGIIVRHILDVAQEFSLSFAEAISNSDGEFSCLRTWH